MKIIKVLGIWFIAYGALTAAADFWEEKGFTSWSDREVEEMMTDSPWSRTVTVALRIPAAGRDFGASSIGRGGSNMFGVRLPDGAGDRNEANPGDDRRPSNRFGATSSPQRAALTVTWRSALPIKQAVVRSDVGRNQQIPSELQQFLEQDEPYYVVSVSGIPEQLHQAAISETFLRRDNGKAIAPYNVEVVEQGELSMLVWYFPRHDAITLEDDEVEFVTKLGDTEIRRSFQLEDMLFEGLLAL